MAHNASAPGTKSGTDGKLALPSRGAHQQQIGDIGARDQQNHAHCSQHHQQRVARIANNAVAQRSNGKLLLRICFGKIAVVLRGCCHQLCVGLLHRDAGLEHSGNLKEVVHVVAGWLKLKRQPHIRLRVGDKLFSNYTDDRVRLVAQGERLPDYGRIAAELALPQAVAQHHHIAAVGRVFLRSEGSSQHDRRAIHAEVTLRDMNAVELFRPVTAEVESGAGIVVGSNILEYAGLALIEVELGNAGEVTGNYG